MLSTTDYFFEDLETTELLEKLSDKAARYFFEIESHENSRTPYWAERDYQSDFSSQLSRYFLCFKKNNPAILVAFLLYRANIDSEVEIFHWSVREKAKGLGRSFFEQFLKKTAARRVILEVGHQNAPAIKLYTALGFSEIGRRDKYYKNGETAIVMELKRP